MVLLLYKDDILRFLDKDQGFDFVVGQFKEQFRIQTTRKTEKFLGFTFDHNGDTTKSHNELTVDHLLRHFRMTESKGAKSPGAGGTDFCMDGSDN